MTMEASASAPTHPEIELEPPEWQPRAMRLAPRLMAGAAAFFFISFVFAYFYLRSLDSNQSWKIGHVDPPIGFGVVILVVLLGSGVAIWLAVRRTGMVLVAGGAALVLGLAAVVLQVAEWTTLGFGPASGGYASVFVGWTAFFNVVLLAACYWIETQVATAWRRGRETARATPADVLTDPDVIAAGLEACAFFWLFMVLNGVVMFVLLYLL